MIQPATKILPSEGDLQEVQKSSPLAENNAFGT